MPAIPFSTSPANASVSSDDLATVVVRRLEQRPAGQSWGLFKTLLLGIPSFGLLPMLAWPARFREYAADETLAMQELAQWAKLRGRQPAAVGPLLCAAEDTAASPIPFVLSLILSALIVGVFAIQIANVREFSIASFLDMTYSFDPRFAKNSPLAQGDFVYRVWIIALSLGYAVQWLHIRLHAANVKRFVERFNPVAEAEGVPGVIFPTRGRAAFWPFWILTAIVLARHGAWWGIPMVLAGMAQLRYTNATSRIVRKKLAMRLKDVVMLRQSPMNILAPRIIKRCPNPRCLASLQPASSFCARCGTAVTRRREA